jgi:hypothetical protein
MDQGFVAKPYAIKKVIKAPDGTLRVVYQDIRTGKVVNPEGYQVIQSDNTIDNQVTTTQGQSVAKPTTQTDKQNSDNNITQDILQSHDASHVATDTAHTDAGSSYFNKPGWMGFAGWLPGPLGTLGLLGNLGINASNTEAVNKQKEALGFTTNPMSTLGGVAIDKHGYIGDLASTRPNGTVTSTPVSFEATDPNNRTTYTPEEARMHELLGGAVPATDAQKATAVKDFNQEFPDQQSFYDKIANATKSIFGGGPKPATGVGSATGPAPGSGVTMSHGYPSAPSAPTSGFGITNSSDNSPDDRDQHTTSTSGGYSSPGLY